jgi:hypothetical protein
MSVFRSPSEEVDEKAENSKPRLKSAKIEKSTIQEFVCLEERGENQNGNENERKKVIPCGGIFSFTFWFNSTDAGIDAIEVFEDDIEVVVLFVTVVVGGVVGVVDIDGGVFTDCEHTVSETFDFFLSADGFFV